MPDAATIARRLAERRRTSPPLLDPQMATVARPRVQPVRLAPLHAVGGPEAVSPDLIRLFRRLAQENLPAEPSPVYTASGQGRTLQTLAAITVTAADFDVDLTNGRRQPQVGETVWQNESAYQLVVTIGGHSYSIRPWDADKLPANGMVTAHVHPVALTSPIPTAPSASLLVVVAPPGVTIPGTYPSPASRQSASYGQQQILDTATTTNNTVTHNGITIPIGTHSLMVVGLNTISANGAGKVQITGVVTGLDYLSSDGNFPSVIPNSGAAFFSALAPDTTVNVKYVGDAGTDLWWLIALGDPTAVAIINQLSAFLSDTVTGAALFTQSQGPRAKDVLGVTLSEANPALWQFPQAAAVSLGAALGANATAVIVAAVANQSVWVHKWSIMANISPILNLEGGDGTRLAGCNPAVGVEHIEAPVGKTASGQSLVLRNSSGALTYTQGVGYTQG